VGPGDHSYSQRPLGRIEKGEGGFGDTSFKNVTNLMLVLFSLLKISQVDL